LAVYVAIDGGRALWLKERPDRTTVDVVILALSVVVMPLLALAKREVADKMRSGALRADSLERCGPFSVV
jgi:divalent metal cation (Fe/Co/Zn/Cd) transporter